MHIHKCTQELVPVNVFHVKYVKSRKITTKIIYKLNSIFGDNFSILEFKIHLWIFFWHSS